MAARIRSLFLVLLFLAEVFTVAGQNSLVSKDFGIAVGWTGFAVRENLLSPVRHDGNFPSLSIFHQKNMSGAIREIHADFVFNMLTTRFEDEANSAGTNLALNYRYLFKVFGSDSTFSACVGPIGGISAYLMYFNMWDESHIYWLNTYFVGANTRLQYPTSGMSRLILDVNVPVVVLASRPPVRFLYKEMNPEFGWIVSRLHDHMKLTSFDHHQAINASVEYRITFSTRFKLGLFWKASYVRNTLVPGGDLDIMINMLGTRLYF